MNNPKSSTVKATLTKRYKSRLQNRYQLEFESITGRLTTMADLHDPEWLKRRDGYVDLWMPVVRQAAASAPRARKEG